MNINFNTVSRIFKNEGLIGLFFGSLKKITDNRMRKQIFDHKNIVSKSMIKQQDLNNIGWPSNQYSYKSTLINNISNVSWVLPPLGEGGGIQNILRFVNYLYDAGMNSTIYVYNSSDYQLSDQDYSVLKRHCSTRDIKLYSYDDLLNSVVTDSSDVQIATSWETAYPVYNMPKSAKKVYFVQDFEPSFFPVGSKSALAENTYKFGFFGITAGKWLSSKLLDEYDMDADYFDFGSDESLYELTNFSKRNKIFFYARPYTQRRGFELGVLTLNIFHKLHPEIEIHLAGEDIPVKKLGFPCVGHGSMKLEELSELYNSCAAALVISLTNFSLLPLEVLRCGTIPVVTDGQNNRMVSDNNQIVYSESLPKELAAKLSYAVEKNSNSELSKILSKSVSNNNWDDSGAKFVKLIKGLAKNG
jgi:glycosyltransferase involved in cell wall biosynthesis